mgnify:CR=1 FL=1
MDQTTQLSSNRGYLEIILGPMFSGKTSKILEIYKQCKFCNIPVMVINHAVDTRYGMNVVSTHDGQKIPSLFTDNIRKFWETENSQDVEVVLINEGQFFEGLYDAVEQMLLEKKRVYVCGLDGDFKRKKFGELLDLIPLSDNVYKLHSLCGLCKTGRKGIFSLRITDDSSQTLVGVDNYIPVCRNCFVENSH